MEEKSEESSNKSVKLKAKQDGEMPKGKTKKVWPETNPSGGKSRKTKDFGERLADDLHPKFLDAIKDTQPLAYLASLMLLITIFSTGEFIGARLYAIGSAVVFLSAFVISLIYKIVPFPFAAIFSFAATGTGIFLLIFVIAELIKTVPLVKSAFYFSFIPAFMIGVSPLLYVHGKTLREDMKKEVKQKHILVLGDILMFIGFSLIVALYLIVIIGRAIGISFLENISMDPIWLFTLLMCIGSSIRVYFFLK